VAPLLDRAAMTSSEEINRRWVGEDVKVRRAMGFSIFPRRLILVPLIVRPAPGSDTRTYTRLHTQETPATPFALIPRQVHGRQVLSAKGHLELCQGSLYDRS
jgi:hypothetical protein